MRSRHASMSFITSVEAKNIPKLQTNHSTFIQFWQENSQFLHIAMGRNARLG